jgi:type IV pilus assembly protein PilE
MPRRQHADRAATGFTLVELMIAVAILGLLSALAWPMLQDAVHRSRRADAMSALAMIQQAQERWRANNPEYKASLTGLTGGDAARSPDQHYDLSLVDDGLDRRTGYTARATARSGSPQGSDTRCQWLQVTVNGGSIAYTSSGSGGVNAAPDPCWAR